MKVAFIKTKSATILWDVERIKRDYASRALPETVRTMSVSDLLEQCTHVDYDVSKSDMTRFPIVAMLAKRKYRLLEGDEQLHKARKLGLRTVSCCVLKPEEHKNYIIGYDEETYLRAVAEYWEDDLDEEDDPE